MTQTELPLPPPTDKRPPAGRWRWVLAALALAGLGWVAWARVGALDLPSPPPNVTLQSSGLAGLDSAGRLDAYLRENAAAESTFSADVPATLREAAEMAHDGLAMIQRGEHAAGLAKIREAVSKEPTSLVLANAYRMTVFDLQRKALAEASRQGVIMPQFPPHLADEPIAFFKALDGRVNTRETKLALALSWVDHMLLYPALEIKAPSSVEAVNIVTGVIEDGNAAYVPALFARGLNHLHRPARLVWPESEKTGKDAAARDVGMCVAIGRKLGVGSNRLQAMLAMTLGDAYVKAGRLGVARSWWQIARNLSHEKALLEAVERRFTWRDEEILDRLEEELDRARSELDHPMTDLAMMWK